MYEADLKEILNMLKDYAAKCRQFYEIEELLDKAKEELTASENKLIDKRIEFNKLKKQAGESSAVDPVLLEREIENLHSEYEGLGIFAMKRKRVIRELLPEKKAALEEAKKNVALREKFEKESQRFARWSELESKHQAELKSNIEAVSQQISVLTAAIEKGVSALLEMPDEVLSYLLPKIGADMAYLPTAILENGLTEDTVAYMKELPVQKQVRLLYQYDTPIHFGGREWNVLRVQEDKALLLLRDGYTCPKYYREKYGWEEKPSAENAFHRGDSSSVTWETSEARKILNKEFLTSLHLKATEKILPGYMNDKVFCLSKSEVEQYLGPRQRRVEGAWWLRDTEYVRGCEYYEARTDVFYVSMHGSIDKTKSSMLVNNGRDGQSMCFRPALWIELPYDSFDEEWNEEIIDVNCKGMWTSENSYSRSSISFGSFMESQSRSQSGGFTDNDAWHAITSGMMGGSGIDGTGM